MLQDFFGTIYDALYSQIVPIPLDNPASILYVILNFILGIVAIVSYQQEG